MNTVLPQTATQVITQQQVKLEKSIQEIEFRRNHFVEWLQRRAEIDVEVISAPLRSATSFPMLAEQLAALAREDFREQIIKSVTTSRAAQRDANAARALLGEPALQFTAFVLVSTHPRTFGRRNDGRE